MQNRREFMKGSSVFAAMMAAAPTIVVGQGAARVFKVGMIGAGGRSNGAFNDLAEAAKMLGHQVRLVACCDWFLDKARSTAKRLNCDESRAFGGAGGYKKVIETDCEIVIMATPPAFRPLEAAAAIAAGKHIFAEKPVAVDPQGVRHFLKTAAEAKAKKLSIAAGTQRRHQASYLRQAKALRDGVIQPILGGAIYWNGRVPFVRERRPEDNNAAYLANNWVNWMEISGDHIVEQHVHNIDVANWFLGRLPRTATAFGARMRRRTGNQYDFFSVDFDYDQGVHIHSMCRQISGCSDFVGERFRSADAIISGGGRITRDGQEVKLEPVGQEGNPYVMTHLNLLKGILSGDILNEGENVAMSSACAILGRMSAYTGQTIRMSDILTNEKADFYNMNCRPAAIDFDSGKDVELPPENVAPIPGTA